MFRSRFLLRPVHFPRLHSGHRPSQAASQHAIRLFFSTSARTTETKELSSPFAILRNSNSSHDIQMLYPGILQVMQRAAQKQDASESIGKEDVKLVLSALGASGRPEDMQRIDDIIQGILPQLNMEDSLDVYFAVLQGLVAKGDLHAVYHWLRRTVNAHGLAKSHFDYVMTDFPFATVMDILDFERNARQDLVIRVDLLSFVKAVRDVYGRLRCAPSEREARLIFHFVRTWPVSWNKEASDLVYNLYLQAGRTDLATQSLQQYHQDARPPTLKSEQDEMQRLQKIKEEQGLSVALEFLPPMDVTNWEDRRLSIRIGLMLVEGLPSVDDLHLLDQKLPIGSTRRWTRVIKDLLAVHRLDEALIVYQESRKADIHMDAAMVGNMIHYMSYRSPEAGSERLLDLSLSVYQDFVKYADAHPAQGPRFHSPTPDSSIYRSLLRGIAKSPNVHKYSSAVTSLIHDMSRYDVGVVPSIAASVLSISIRTAETIDAALQAYREGRHLLASSGDGFIAVLKAFSGRLFQSSKLSSDAAKEYFSIVKDMQRAGVCGTARIYTILLSTVGHAASRLRRQGDLTAENLEYLIATTRRAHDQLTLDPSLTPTPVVFSQLINTYQRLGCLGDAYRVWELCYLTGNYTAAAVSNILDGCGHAGDPFTAKTVWNRLCKNGFQFDVKHYETYIECMGRIGDIAEAMRIFQTIPPHFDKSTSTRELWNWARKHGKLEDVTNILRGSAKVSNKS